MRTPDDMPRRTLLVLALLVAIACGRSPLGDAVVQLGETIREREASAEESGAELVVLESWTLKVDCWAQADGWVDWPGLRPGDVRDAALMVCSPAGDSCAPASVVGVHAGGVDVGGACAAGGVGRLTLALDL